MAKFDYDKVIADVIKLLDEFGYNINISRQSITYNSSTSQVTNGALITKSFSAVVLPLSEKSANESGLDLRTAGESFTITEGKLVYAYPIANDGTFIPNVEDNVDILDGYGWKIVSLTKIAPANKDVLYIFAISKQ